MTIATQGDVVTYSDTGTTVSTAQGVVLMTPGMTASLGSSANPLYTQTSALQTTADLTTAVVTFNAATTTTLIALTAATKIRVYRMEVDCAAADVLTFNAASGNRVQTYGGIGHIIYDFATRPWFTCATATLFSVTSTTTAAVTITLEYTKVA